MLLFPLWPKQSLRNEGGNSSGVENYIWAFSETQWHPFAYCYLSLCIIKGPLTVQCASSTTDIVFFIYTLYIYSFSAISDPCSVGLSPTARNGAIWKHQTRKTHRRHLYVSASLRSGLKPSTGTCLFTRHCKQKRGSFHRAWENTMQCLLPTWRLTFMVFMSHNFNV